MATYRNGVFGYQQGLRYFATYREFVFYYLFGEVFGVFGYEVIGFLQE